MSMLSDYRKKLSELRKIKNEMFELANADDVLANVKHALIFETHQAKIVPGLREVRLELCYYNHGGSYEDVVRAYLAALKETLDYAPVDNSRGDGNYD